MDDLKTFGRDNQQQERLLQTVKRFSDDINMKFGLDKCATAEFKRGKLTKTTSIFFFLYTCIQSKNLRYKLLYTLLKLLYNTTTTIPRGAKYNDNPEALKKEKIFFISI